MEFVDKLLQKTDYLEQLKKLELLEQNREFCRHGLSHLLDTARIAWIRYLELYDGQQVCRQESVYRQECICQQQIIAQLEREMVYLAALLHDLGRIQEYEAGIPHHEASVAVAERLLREIDYPKEKTALIIVAIAGHRRDVHALASEMNSRGEQLEALQRHEGELLRELLKWADKQSRTCFYCETQQECNWQEEKRNFTIRY